MTSVGGERQARNRYTFFAGKAKKDGFEQYAAIFLETAEQEKEHAKRMFKYLEGGEVEITCKFPAGVIGSTLENLIEAANGENEEWSDCMISSSLFSILVFISSMSFCISFGSFASKLIFVSISFAW